MNNTIALRATLPCSMGGGGCLKLLNRLFKIWSMDLELLARPRVLRMCRKPSQSIRNTILHRSCGAEVFLWPPELRDINNLWIPLEFHHIPSRSCYILSIMNLRFIKGNHAKYWFSSTFHCQKINFDLQHGFGHRHIVLGLLVLA